jgi:hypothetical protein
MTWLVWRQHRIQLLIGAAILAVFAVLLLVTGLQMASQWHSALVACTATHSCGDQGGLFLGNRAVGFLIIMTLGAPVLAGLFWGAPLVAAELETGTSQFAWMQSITRRRWLAIKAGWMLLAAAVWGGVISALVTWWSGPNNALHLDAFNPGRSTSWASSRWPTRCSRWHWASPPARCCAARCPRWPSRSPGSSRCAR